MTLNTRYFIVLVFCFGCPCSASYCQTHEIDSLKQVLFKMPADSNKAKACYEISKLFSGIEDFQSAFSYVDSGIIISNRVNYSEGVGGGNFYRARIFQKDNNQDSAIKYFLKAIPFFKQNKKKQSLIYENIGAAYDASTQYDSAIHYFNIAFKQATLNRDTTQQIRIITNIGAIYYYQAKYTEASENYLKALRIGEAMKDSQIIAANYINVSNMFGLSGNSAKAIEYCLKAIPICEATGNYRSLGDAYDNMADEYTKMNQNEKALAFSYHALSCYIKADTKAEAAVCYRNISDYFIGKGDSLSEAKNEADALRNYHHADSLLNQGHLYAIQSDDKVALANILMNSGFVKSKLGYDAQAIKNYEEAVSVCKEAGLVKELAMVYKHLAALYAESNVNSKAYQYLVMSMQLRDSIVNRENKEIIGDLNAKYESEKKEQEINILAKENEARSLAEEKQKQKKNFAFAGIVALIILGAYIFNLYSKRKKLSNQLEQSLNDLKKTQQQLIQTEKEKEAENIRLRISRDIHDDIGGNLTKIALLSEMTSMETDKNSPETISNLERISDYSRTINSSLSEIVWAITPKHDTLESLIVYMRNHVHKFFEGAGITYQINFPEEFENRPLNPDLKRNIFLVLKESLNNILKYAHAKVVVIDFKIDNAKFELKIKDDGKGFSPLSLEEGSGERLGNGLNNMSYRTQQTGGSLIINSSRGNGCEIIASGILS